MRYAEEGNEENSHEKLPYFTAENNVATRHKGEKECILSKTIILRGRTRFFCER